MNDMQAWHAVTMLAPLIPVVEAKNARTAKRLTFNQTVSNNKIAEHTIDGVLTADESSGTPPGQAGRTKQNEVANR